MEEDTLVKHSVAELAGMFKGHAPPKPAGIEGGKPIRRRPPCSLKLHTKKDGGEGEEEKSPIISPHPPKVKPKSSPLIEKLQANLALSPTGPQLPPKSPGRQPSMEEAPTSFEKPAEGAVLPSINKGRVRLSIKRRPPTRQHRKSCGEEGEGAGGPESPQQNGDEDDVFLEVGKEAAEVQEITSPPLDSGEAPDRKDSLDSKMEEGEVEAADGAPRDSTMEPEEEVPGGEEAREPMEEVPGEVQVSDSSADALEEPETHTEQMPETEERTQTQEEREVEEEKSSEEKQEEPKSTAD
ncbi:hypothetical protein AAFF_G00313190 [Aldrovandia affinis]|uniref:FAM21/CAPZIP domain-containing protein n=1 Tax=Aldrovandia affinis TaxID=143900 RepID=A0AAD7WQU6_9TELE|nr:hypothetical protein AAFF_G00313190 [Aldrovandia affinis]